MDKLTLGSAAITRDARCPMPTLDYLTLISIAAHQPRCGVQHVHDDDAVVAAAGQIEHAQCCIDMDTAYSEQHGGEPVLSSVQLYLGAACRCGVCQEMVAEYYHAP